jgi:hypothetical protein
MLAVYIWLLSRFFDFLSQRFHGAGRGVCQCENALAPVLVALHLSGRRGQEFFSGFSIVWEARNAHAYADLNCLSGFHGEPLRLDSVTNSLANCVRNAARGHWHDGDELVTGITSEYVHLPQFLANHAGNTGQHAIAYGVAKQIIDVFEVIYVHANDRQGLASHALTFGNSLLEHHVEATGVGQFRQRID